MTTLRGKSALVIGGSSGVGRATVHALLKQGTRVTAVARNGDRLRALAERMRANAFDSNLLSILAGDATDEGVLSTVLRDADPDVIVMAMGINPKSVLFVDYDWNAFSHAWNTDLKATFHLLKHAVTLPLRSGTTIVVVSSGAAINGSPISGGYAGAKRMQWLLAGYAQKFSDANKLGIRMLTVVPTQLIEGTEIAERASAAYGAMSGITSQEFMSRFPAPLTADKVATAIVNALRGEGPQDTPAIAVSGIGVEGLK